MNNEIKIEKSRAGRPTKLTNEILKQLTELWQLSDERCMSDAEIALSLGIKPKQLENWLSYDTKGISGIRARARARIKMGYISKLNIIAIAAFKKMDFKVASNICIFLLERMFPREFGKYIKITENKSHDWLETASEEELDIFIAENQALLKEALYEKK
ncbi:MAG: hypothetical protein ABFD79_04165 [Phycisphaerales bacterium]